MTGTNSGRAVEDHASHRARMARVNALSALSGAAHQASVMVLMRAPADQVTAQLAAIRAQLNDITGDHDG